MPRLVDRRIGLLFIGFVALLAIAGLRAVWLGVVRAGKLQHAADTQQIQDIPVPAARGSIVDRNGVELAVSESADDIAVTPYLVKDPNAAARRLAPLLGQSAGELLPKLTKKHTGFVYLARMIPGPDADKVKKLEIPGIQLIPRQRRTYPRSWLASQLLGTVGTDGGGLSGLEYGMNTALRGRDGDRRIVSDALGQPIDVTDTKTAAPGKTVKLTIDSAIQEKTEEVLQGVGQTYRPKGATAIVMDPRTSRVLAMANWPRIDANDLGAAPSYARQNRAVGFTYEP